MATITEFGGSPNGNNINYNISWTSFSCGGTRSIEFRLFDVNRNAFLDSTTISSLNVSGSYSGSFTSVYQGLFEVYAFFRCAGVIVFTDIGPSISNESTSTIEPPDPGDPGDPDPIEENPDSPEGEGICIPTTGAVSMGDLNVIFGRDRSLANTLLSGSSNPSVAPSLFGVSFLPNNVVSPGKLTPNAISEFRGYCHVPPIQNPTLSYSIATNTSGRGSLNISYIPVSGSRTNLFINLDNPSQSENASGEITVRPGFYVILTFTNNSTGAVTAIEVSNLTDPLYENTGSFTNDQFTFTPLVGDAYNVTAIFQGGGAGGGGEEEEEG